MSDEPVVEPVTPVVELVSPVVELVSPVVELVAPVVELVSPVVELVETLRSTPRPIVLIDGGSGSGKTTLATALAPALGAQLVRLDDFYPGWDGLEAASASVRRDVLDPLHPGWRRWDWVEGAPAEWHPLDPSVPLVIEGSGCLSRTNRELATFGIWVELDAPTRKKRALARDGAAYAQHWDRWAAQELSFGERERPTQLADLVLTDEEVAVLVDRLASSP